MLDSFGCWLRRCRSVQRTILLIELRFVRTAQSGRDERQQQGPGGDPDKCPCRLSTLFRLLRGLFTVRLRLRSGVSAAYFRLQSGVFAVPYRLPRGLFSVRFRLPRGLFTVRFPLPRGLFAICPSLILGQLAGPLRLKAISGPSLELHGYRKRHAGSVGVEETRLFVVAAEPTDDFEEIDVPRKIGTVPHLSVAREPLGGSILRVRHGQHPTCRQVAPHGRVGGRGVQHIRGTSDISEICHCNEEMTAHTAFRREIAHGLDCSRSRGGRKREFMPERTPAGAGVLEEAG